MKLILLLLIALVAGGNGFANLELRRGKPIAEKNENLPASLSDEDFVVKSDNTFIELCGDYNDFRTDEKFINVSYANERRAYDTFLYENFTLSNGATIFMFALITPAFETSRNIRVGDTISSVLKKYGQPNEIKESYMIGDNIAINEYYQYADNKHAIMFYIDKNEVITEIRFACVHP